MEMERMKKYWFGGLSLFLMLGSANAMPTCELPYEEYIDGLSAGDWEYVDHSIGGGSVSYGFSSGSLDVTSITTTGSSGWRAFSLDREVSLENDFSIDFDMDVDTPQIDDIQIVYVDLLDENDNLLARAGLYDAWTGYRGAAKLIGGSEAPRAYCYGSNVGNCFSSGYSSFSFNITREAGIVTSTFVDGDTYSYTNSNTDFIAEGEIGTVKTVRLKFGRSADASSTFSSVSIENFVLKEYADTKVDGVDLGTWALTNSTNFGASEVSGNLDVYAVTDATDDDEWSIVSIYKDIGTVTDFDFCVPLTWSTEGSVDAMQFAAIVVRADDDEELARVSLHDAWINYYGATQATGGGDSYNGSLGSLPNVVEDTIRISRFDDTLEAYLGSTEVLYGFDQRDAKAIELLFGHSKANDNNQPSRWSYFGSVTVDSLYFVGTTVEAKSYSMVTEGIELADWDVTLSGASGWTYSNADNDLVVTDITDTTVDSGWANVSVTMQVTAETDFDLSFDIAWQGPSPNYKAMQYVYVEFVTAGATISRGGHYDAWAYSTGSTKATLDTYTLDSGIDGTYPDGETSFRFRRDGNYISIYNEGEMKSVQAFSDAVEEIRIRFGYSKTSAPSSSVIGTVAVKNYYFAAD